MVSQDSDSNILAPGRQLERKKKEREREREREREED
jgi:hypothetical protein